MTALEKLKEVSAFLRSKGIKDHVREAEILLTEALQIKRHDLYTKNINLTEDLLKRIDNFSERRSKGEPIQYIVGYVEFYGLRINVGKGVLIPRPETELLVEEAIKLIRRQKTEDREGISILDLCTGSGCIAISIARHFPDVIIYGVDSSDIAIDYAKRNALDNGVKNVHFIKGDLFDGLDDLTFDFIISNPPYIRSADIKDLQREIKEFEPLEALDGGEDGLDFYKRILRESKRFLKDKGTVILEIGYGQHDHIREIALKNGFRYINFIEDYSKIKRIFIGRFTSDGF